MGMFGRVYKTFSKYIGDAF